MIAESIKRGGMLFCFGTGHSHIIAEELFGRAGGLITARAILEPELMVHENGTKATYMERLPGLARIYLQTQPIERGDVLIIVSNSGRNAVPVEMAIEAKKMGVLTIAITSVAHSKSTDSRHSSGLKLFELVDIVIDNCGEPGDAAVSIDGSDIRAGATSTIAGSLIVNSIMIDAVTQLVKEGFDPSVMYSSNNQNEANAKFNAEVRSRFMKEFAERLIRMEKRSWEGLSD
jgi:uncharacterized phosphosugar-binding protein